MLGRAFVAAKWHSRRVPLGALALLALALCAPRPRRRRGLRSPGLPAARAERAADRARADGHASDLGGARVALGASLVDRPALAGVARARAAAGASPTTPRIRSRPGSTAARRAARAGARRSRTTWPATCSPTARCGGGWPCASASRCVRWARAASCSTGATCRRRRARRYARFVHELRLELGPRAQIVVTVPPVRTKRALRTGAYDLRALARPARLLVLAWNEHGPRSEPGPGRVARVLEADAAHGAARRAALARADGRADLGLALDATAGAGAEQATQAQLFPQATEPALQRPYGARVGEHAWVESDRSVQLKLLVARQAQHRGRGALGARRGVLRDLASAASWRPRGSRARPRTP